MFINEVPNNAELAAIIVNQLRDLYGIKFRKEKKLKNQQVNLVCQRCKKKKNYEKMPTKYFIV